jgi:hypothetical protein
MAFNAKEGGDVNNYATNVVAGGASDADAVGVGGAGILGGNVPPTSVTEKEELSLSQPHECPDGTFREKC